MSRLQPNDGLNKISARRLNRLFDGDAEQSGFAGTGKSKLLPYTKAIAKNTTGYTITPGSPIELTNFTADDTPAGARVPGYYTADRAAKPYLSRKRIAIALEGAEPNDLFSVAIDGVVRANFDNTDWPFASLITDASGIDYQSKITSSPAMGFAMILRKLDASSALIRFGMVQSHRLGISIGAITASTSASPVEVDVTANISGGGTETVKAYTTVSTIAATTAILLLPVDGIFYAVKVC